MTAPPERPGTALISVHKVMIGTAIAFLALFGVRAFVVGTPGIGVLCVGGAVALSGYLRWFLRTKGRL